MKLLCVGGAADGIVVDFGDQEVIQVREPIRLGRPTQIPPDVEETALISTPYKRITFYSDKSKMTICAAPHNWTYSDVLNRLIEVYPRQPVEKDPFG